jgi:phospholipase/lecithinase/hemolysin
VKSVNRELDAQIVLFDLHRTIGFILANSAALEYTNRRDACFSIALQAFHPGCDFDEFVFFDEIHPSARTHERASRAMYAAVPEPRH